MSGYKGVPNKKRDVLIDESGDFYPLGLGVNLADRSIVGTSGTLTAGGHLTVTGTVFKTNSVVTASYNDSSAGTAPIAIALTSGTVTFKGDANANFYYIVIN